MIVLTMIIVLYRLAMEQDIYHMQKLALPAESGHRQITSRSVQSAKGRHSMTKAEKIDLVRSELTELRKLARYIEYITSTQKALLKRKETVSALSKKLNEQKNISSIKRQNSGLKKSILRYKELLKKYSQFAEISLSIIEQTLFFDYYVNLSPLETIAGKLHYSVSGIKKKIKVIIIKLAEHL